MSQKTKKRLLQEATEQANQYHAKYVEACQDAQKSTLLAIKCVVLCGKALIECKKLKQHGTWKQWIEDNFTKGDTGKSYETAVNYMTIAEEIQSDYIQAGLEKGLINLSQNSILQAIRRKKQAGKDAKQRPSHLTQEQWEEYLQKEEFQKYLRNKSRDQISVQLNRLQNYDNYTQVLYLLYLDTRGIASYGIWDAFREKLNEVLQQENEKDEFHEEIKATFEQWKNQNEKTECFDVPSRLTRSEHTEKQKQIKQTA